MLVRLLDVNRSAVSQVCFYLISLEDRDFLYILLHISTGHNLHQDGQLTFRPRGKLVLCLNEHNAEVTVQGSAAPARKPQILTVLAILWHKILCGNGKPVKRTSA